MYKSEFQKWLSTIPFSHRVDIEPSPSTPMTKMEIEQRFRKILFHINKRYVGGNFPKYEPEYKFWLLWMNEGGDGLQENHYHLLLHSPSKIYKPQFGKKRVLPKRSLGSPVFDMMTMWIREPVVNPVTGSIRKMVTQKKDQFHIGCESYIEHLPLQISKIKSVVGSVRYDTKKYHRQNDGWNIIGFVH